MIINLTLFFHFYLIIFNNIKIFIIVMNKLHKNIELIFFIQKNNEN